MLHKNLCVVNNVHGLLIYLLKYDPEAKKTHFILTSELSRLVNIDDNHMTIVPKVSVRNITGLLYTLYFFYFKQWLLRFRFRKLKHFGQDCLYFSTVLRKGAIIVEDGERTYLPSKFERHYLKKLLIPSKYTKMHGRDWFTNKIVLSKHDEAPEELKGKGIAFSFKSSWDELDMHSRRKICEVFSFNYDDILRSILQLNGTSILFTQPLSEDNILTEKEKVEIYKQINQKYEDKLLLKTHPRETTDYESFGFDVVDFNFPSQFLEFFNIKFFRAITLYSSAINDINSEFKIKYGTFGIIELINITGEIPYKQTKG